MTAMTYYLNLLRALAWWARTVADARYRENYRAYVTTNERWYAILHHAIKQRHPE